MAGEPSDLCWRRASFDASSHLGCLHGNSGDRAGGPVGQSVFPGILGKPHADGVYLVAGEHVDTRGRKLLFPAGALPGYLEVSPAPAVAVHASRMWNIRVSPPTPAAAA